MSDRGLTHRLSQRSRRAGLMIGISMIVTVAFCAVAFTVIYTALEEFMSDFVSSDENGSAASSDEGAGNESGTGDSSDPFSSLDLSQLNEDENADDSAPNSEASVPTPTPPSTSGDTEEGQILPDEDGTEVSGDDDDEFNPDFQIGGSSSINFREEPTTASSILDTLPPATPLEYLGEDAPTDSVSDGSRWMMFRTEDGLEGWIRAIDTTDYEP